MPNCLNDHWPEGGVRAKALPVGLVCGNGIPYRRILMIPRCLAAVATPWILAASIVADTAGTITSTNPSPEAVVAQKRLRVAPGLNLSIWASEPLVENVVSVSFDNQGRAYVVETGRRRTSVFDIRGFTKWLDDDFALRTVGERAALLHNYLDPKNPQYREFSQVAGKGGKPGGLEDFNHDGVLDWKDLEVEADKIQLVTDTAGLGHADTAQVFAGGFTGIASGVAAGVLPQGSNVWFTCIPDLWRFPSVAAGTSLPAPREKLLHGFGVHIASGGHDMHGLIKGFDGRIYFSVADRGSCVTNREGRVFALPDCGAVFRCEPDGSQFEVFAKGLRNPQELAFDDLGNLWTGDNNGDGGDKARWTLVLEGADYGWTMGWQWLPKMGAWNSERLWHLQDSNTAAYLVPPVAHIGHGPAGIAYYPGTGLGDRFTGYFFMTDFPGGVRMFKVEPEGAFFRAIHPEGNPKAFEDNSPANFAGKLLWELSPVDVTFPPFGGAIVGDWVQGWEKTGKGRLWHVTDPTLKNDPDIERTRQLLAAGFGKTPEKELISLLDEKDMRVRLEAQWELAGRGLAALPALYEAAWNTNYSTRVRFHSVRALGQLARQQPLASFGNELFPLIALTEDADPEIRAQASIVLAEGRLQNAGPAVAKLLLDPMPRVRAIAGLSLAQLINAPAVRKAMDPLGFKDYPPALLITIKRCEPYIHAIDLPGEEQLVKMAVGNDGRDPAINHAVVMLLGAFVKHGQKTAMNAMAASSQPTSVRMAALLVQRHLGDPSVAWWLHEADPALVLESARAIGDTSIVAARPALASLLDDEQALHPPIPWPASLHYTSQEWTHYVLRRAVNAAWKMNDASSAKRIAGVAARAGLPVSLRLEALEDLADWAQPPKRDKVTGLYDPIPPRDATAARAALESIWPAVSSAGADTNIILAALDAGTTLGLPQILVTIEALANHSDAGVRAEATRLLETRKPLSPVELADQLRSGPITMQSVALRRLAGTTNSEAVAAISEAFGRLRSGSAPKELQLDIAETARSIPALAVTYKEWTNSFPHGDNLAPYRVALYGGNAASGKKLFAERADWGCQRCHKLDGEGGDVGPDLTGVGRRRDREYVLRSVLDPNAEISPGFDSVLIELKDGTSVTGIVKSETDLVLQIQTAEGNRTVVTKANIASQNRGLSPMPDGLGELMTKRELRDLIEALSN